MAGGAGLPLDLGDGARGRRNIDTDSLGRMKGKFFWDREGKEDDKATCWMRVIQLPIGGSQALARVGWRCIVRLRLRRPGPAHRGLPRGQRRAHGAVQLPEGRQRDVVQDALQPGGGKYNEITMEDGGGGQKFGVTASKDWNEQVNNNKTEKIGANEKLEVGTTLDATVGQAAHSSRLAPVVTCTISADAGVSVTGDRTKSVGASETVSISGSLTEKVAASDSESVGGNHMTLAALGVTRTSKGSQSLTVAGSMASIAGMGLGVMVAGAKSETVGGAKLVISGGLPPRTSSAPPR